MAWAKVGPLISSAACIASELNAAVASRTSVVIPEFGAAAGSSLDAGIGQHPYHDDLFDAALLELKTEIGIGKSVLAPVPLDHDVARLRDEFGMPVAAPHALPEMASRSVKVCQGPCVTSAG